MDASEQSLVPLSETGITAPEAAASAEDAERLLSDEQALEVARNLFAKADELNNAMHGTPFANDGGYYIGNVPYTEDGKIYCTVAVKIFREADMVRKVLELHGFPPKGENGKFQMPESIAAFPLKGQVELIEYLDSSDGGKSKPFGKITDIVPWLKNGHPKKSAVIGGQFWNRQLAQQASDGDGSHRPQNNSVLSAAVVGSTLDVLTLRAQGAQKMQLPSPGGSPGGGK